MDALAAGLAMSLMLTTTAAVWMPEPVQPQDCLQQPAVRALVKDATERMQALDDARASLTIERAMLPGSCAALQSAASALRAWVAARALSRVGGDPLLTAPVMRDIAALEQRRDKGPAGSIRALAADYASASLRAAVAAAQDERGEMALYLEHARSVAEHLTVLGERSPLPLGIDALEGELWFEVDRYADAVRAFERAFARERGARALVGLARSFDRLGESVKACAAYQQSGSFEMAPAVREERDAYLANPLCKN